MTINHRYQIQSDLSAILVGSEHRNKNSSDNNSERKRPRVLSDDCSDASSLVAVAANNKRLCTEGRNSTDTDSRLMSLLSSLAYVEKKGQGTLPSDNQAPAVATNSTSSLVSVSSSPQLRPVTSVVATAPAAEGVISKGIRQSQTMMNNQALFTEATQIALLQHQIQQRYYEQQQQLQAQSAQYYQQLKQQHQHASSTFLRPLPEPPRLPSPKEAMTIAAPYGLGQSGIVAKIKSTQ